MIRVGIIGDIGSGKSYVANIFGYPVFNADNEVSKLYRKDKKILKKLKKILPNYFSSSPIKKADIIKAILANENNLRKIVKIIHAEVRKKMNSFLKKYKRKKIVILDIPLLLENKINKKKDVLIFIQAKKKDILFHLKKRKNYDSRIFRKFKNIQLSLDYKRKKSHYIIKNDFTKRSIQKKVYNVLKEILKWKK